MNFNSIKFQLQLYYGLLLFGVIAGLGAAMFQLASGRMYRQIDAELNQRIRVLAGALNGPPDDPARNPAAHLPPAPGNFHLPPRAETMFGSAANGFYYIITANDGREIARSSNAPTARPKPGAPGERLQEITTPTGERILAGRGIGPDLAELHLTLLQLAAVGAGVWMLGLGGGWILVSRTLRPIARISEAAVKISTGDLAQRINAAETKSELGQLAGVLNSMFARLEAAFAQQRRFSADAAHELRTPVSVLIAQTRAALRKRRSYEENLQTIEACHRAAQRMRKLIVSLLQLARLDAGQEKIRRADFDLALVVDECAELLEPLAAERGVKIILELAPVTISGDAAQIGQVITNLLANALQYNRAEGEVRVNLRAENNFAVLKVADTGQGIARADLPHIFDRFYRADESRSSGNAGLGLAISQAIVSLHGGSIAVSSEAGKGATFEVGLPLAGPRLHPDKASAADPTSGSIRRL